MLMVALRRDRPVRPAINRYLPHGDKSATYTDGARWHLADRSGPRSLQLSQTLHARQRHRPRQTQMAFLSAALRRHPAVVCISPHSLAVKIWRWPERLCRSTQSPPFLVLTSFDILISTTVHILTFRRLSQQRLHCSLAVRSLLFPPRLFAFSPPFPSPAPPA